MQAAIGLAQLDKAPGFIEARRRNFAAMWDGMAHLQDHLILPEATPNSDPSWFGFPIAIRPESPLVRKDLVQFIESRKVATRQLFGGNLTRQPAYANVPHRRIGDLPNSDFVMDQVFWLGVYPGLDEAQIAYMLEVVDEGVRTCRS
jgi:CDP-6-deoxy-D-xylo-4-hexulose-3-dehydrase